ncbi:hypothetical protein [Arthrobacter sp. zg-Y1110]|uniref:hypothetical protein n=1 Tax=Arthrobacter sp. zg-Y1110 TaxID=2886932 RepID=UPI001D155DB6|nr:hypothetical protein [Arthrobacter sp. zg-Y1110]MCC3292883.1 hypothetical protein [Arthrobacter sp. zg-Y1110]UWX86821.1 hypothetical protein N2K99_18435 [Arthrobacter sp. zg-Y1110]
MPVLTLTGESRTRSVQNRRAALDATPVPATLNHGEEFAPADMLISWILEEGDISGRGSTFNAYLWPALRSSAGTFAHWQAGRNAPLPASMPAWLATAAEELRSAFVQGDEMPEGVISRGVGLERTYRINGAAATAFTGSTFIPADLSVSWISGEGDLQQRFRMVVRPDRKSRSLDARHWVGTHNGGYDADTPDWVINAAEQCRIDMLAMPGTLPPRALTDENP